MKNCFAQTFKLGILLLVVCPWVVAQVYDSYKELPKLIHVNDQLMRGAQPRPGGIQRLSELGVKTIINLRGTDSRTRSDEAEAKSLGLTYINVPLPVWGRPENEKVQRVLEIISAPDTGRVFVHCKDGVDRTGMIVALYRITKEGWEPNKATAEATRAGMRRYQYWKRDYINDYSARWRSETQNSNTQLQGHLHPDDDVEDTIGNGVRLGERAVFRLQRAVIKAARKVHGP